MITNFCLFSLTKQNNFSQNFQTAKRKKGWGVQVEDHRCRLIHKSKKHTFLLLQADSYFLLKENLSFPQEGCHFLQGNGRLPFKG